MFDDVVVVVGDVGVQSPLCLCLQFIAFDGLARMSLNCRKKAINIVTVVVADEAFKGQK